MRLWSLDPVYLDPQGLVALWREALLAQAVLRGQTRGYRHHPQLRRFRQAPSPVDAIAAYLRGVHVEALRRGYRFDPTRIAAGGEVETLPVTVGQIEYEGQHLRGKLRRRSPASLAMLESGSEHRPHPLFRIVPGPVEAWEIRHADDH